jgi:hypothetical protein
VNEDQDETPFKWDDFQSKDIFFENYRNFFEHEHHVKYLAQLAQLDLGARQQRYLESKIRDLTRTPKTKARLPKIDRTEILLWFLDRECRDDVIGHLYQDRNALAKRFGARHGPRYATIWFRIQVVRAFVRMLPTRLIDLFWEFVKGQFSSG